MIAWICILLPAVFVNLMRRRVLGERMFLREIQAYLLHVLFLNYVMLCILQVFTPNAGSLYENLNQYNVFALKYLTVSGCIAISLPFLEKGICMVIKNRRAYTERLLALEVSNAYLFTVVYTFILFCMHLIRIYDNNFWEDEAYSIRMSNYTVKEIVQMTGDIDIQPPLYLVILRVLCVLFGAGPEIYHLSALIPYGLTLLLSLTIIWKRFGTAASVIFSTFASMLEHAIQYNVEVRGYSWTAFFVLLAYVELNDILRTDRIRHYTVFCICSVAAAYLHYYALVSVAFFYAVLLLRSLLIYKKVTIKLLFTCIATILGYLPWISKLLGGAQRMAENYAYWWKIPTPKETVSYWFEGKCSLLFLAVFLISVVAAVCKETGVLCKGGKKVQKYKVTDTGVWILAGLFSIFGTSIFGILISRLLRPMSLRYIYPVAVLAWLLLSVCVANNYCRRYVAVTIFAILFMSGLAQYTQIYTAERASDLKCRELVEATKQELTEDSIILTDIRSINWVVLNYYFPGTVHRKLEPDQLALEKDKDYWLYLSGCLSEDMEGRLREQGYTYQIVMEEGNIGTYPVWVYKLEKQKMQH